MGIEAVIAYVLRDESERLVAFASHTLSSTCVDMETTIRFLVNSAMVHATSGKVGYITPVCRSKAAGMPP